MEVSNHVPGYETHQDQSGHGHENFSTDGSFEQSGDQIHGLEGMSMRHPQSVSGRLAETMLREELIHSSASK
jgi:hypothetical protein